MSMAEAVEAGADAFFDEKYGETVRTVRVEGFSHELCGGTHCRASGQIGGFVITGERSIGSGMRRIEAVTGEAAEALVEGRLATLEAAAAAAGAQTPDALPARITELQERIKELEKRLKAGAAAGGLPRPGELARTAESVDGTVLVAHAAPFPSMDEAKGFAKDIRGSLVSGVIAIGMDADEPQLFVTVSEDLVARGISAGDLVRVAVPAIDGKGGGRPEMAQGKGTRRDGLPAALAAIRAHLAG
jgi:alanyl-tRNA synthetase